MDITCNRNLEGEKVLEYQFDLQKTLQASALVLREHQGRIDHLRLLRILYTVDRELLVESGRILTGDSAVAMELGPILNTVYALIQGDCSEASVADWRGAFRKDGFEVVLEGELGRGRLTKREFTKLIEVCNRYRDLDSERLSELTCEFKEWKSAFDHSNPNSSFPIDWEAALEAQGGGDLIGEVRRKLEAHKAAAVASSEVPVEGVDITGSDQ